MSATKGIALVTGASRGLGRNIAINLAKNGTDVIVAFHSGQQEAQAVVAAINALGRRAVSVQLDVSSVKTFDQFFADLKPILQANFQSDKFDYLVNNAGFGLPVPSFEQTTEEQFDSLCNVHFKGVFFFTQKSIPYLNDGGSIVNISTGLTRFSYTGSGAYASMKGGVETLTTYLARELGARGIRANVVAPGAVATDFSGGRLRDSQQMQDYIKSVTALNRVAFPDDIGPVVAFLCSDSSRWVTGQRIEVSGGMHL